MIPFARPEWVALAFFLPAAVMLAAVWAARRRRRAVRALGDEALVRRLAGEDLGRFPLGRTLLAALAAAALGVAAAGPQWGPAEDGGGVRGADVVLVLDASNSMRVADVAPDRLEVERRAARRLLDALEGERVGMVVFAGRGYPLSPLTSDFGALDLYLDNLSPDIVTQGGTSVSAALRQAQALLVGGAGGGGRSGSVVLLSDGDALEERAAVLDEARRAARLGITLHTLGAGTPAGGPVPDVDPETGRRRGFKREPTGEVAVSRLDETLLREAARLTGGIYRPAEDAGAPAAIAAAVRSARAMPDRGERGGAVGGREEPGATGLEDRYEWFVGLALALLVLDSLLERRRGMRRARMLEEGRW
jgi:Ca-activated chloride channel family protein